MSLAIQLSPEYGKALVIGGGKVALKKVKALLLANFTITLICKELKVAFPESPSLKIKIKDFDFKDLDNYQMIFACTDDPSLNQEIAKQCKHQNKLILVADHFEHGNFFSPAVVTKGLLSIAISTEGRDPKLAVAIKKDLEQLIYRYEVDDIFPRRDRKK